MKKVIFLVSTIISLASCEKPQLDELESMTMEVKGWNVTKFIDNNNKHSLTSKSTSVDYTLEVRGEQTLEFVDEKGTSYYSALIWEGDIDGDHTILGSVVYGIDSFEDGDFMHASITKNDSEGNQVGETIHIEPTQSFEIKFIN